jgi:hypothetical protein
LPDETPGRVAATLAAIRERTEAATAGPWAAHSHLRQYSIWHDELDQPLAREVRTWDDAVFISVARTVMPRLLAAVEAALELADKLEPQGPPSSALEEDRMWIRQECADMIRDTLGAALTGEETGDGA